MPFVRNTILKWSLMPNCISILLLFLWNLSVWILLVNFIPSKSGHKYALTVICMLTGYVFCVPLKSKQANEVLLAYIDNFYAKFGGSLKILSDNGTEFKNQLFEKIAKELGMKHKIYTAPYRPSSNGHIEGFHNFLKACIAKHVSCQLEWTHVIPLACAAYNFLPNEHSKESPFFSYVWKRCSSPSEFFTFSSTTLFGK